MTIPVIDIAPLFSAGGRARGTVERAIGAAAGGAGFMIVIGLPGWARLDDRERRALRSLFALPAAARQRLLRRPFNPASRTVYRGCFPLQDGELSYKEGIDIGPDAADPRRCAAGGDPLREPTPWPDPELPEFRPAAGRYYLAMERLGETLLGALGRGLGLAEGLFDAAFEDGNSTLRIIRYPLRPPESYAGRESETFVEHAGMRRPIVGKAHSDSGCLTLLDQDRVGGLQARGPDGGWLDVPALEGALAVNFGELLRLWTGGRVRATEHRVLGTGRERHATAFFYEPSVDAVIEPIPGPNGAPPGGPIRYGDYLWRRMQSFIEFRDLGPSRAAGA